jgi:3-mercaptopyruvate sulfurtransferase SseA
LTPAAQHRALAALALGAALLAALAGSPAPAPRQPALAEVAARIEREADHVTALELAAWIRARRAGLRVVDLRPPGEFASGRVPTAENRTLGDLIAAGVATGETLVLYSAGGTHAAQAWTLLAVGGAPNVFTLQGGFDAWVREVLNPRRARTATPEEIAEFARVAELSRYFGGQPRIDDGAPSAEAPAASLPAPAPSAAELAALARRRGC